MSVCWCVAGQKIKVSVPGTSLTCHYLKLLFAIVLGVLEPILKKKKRRKMFTNAECVHVNHRRLDFQEQCLEVRMTVHS